MSKNLPQNLHFNALLGIQAEFSPETLSAVKHPELKACKSPKMQFLFFYFMSIDYFLQTLNDQKGGKAFKVII